MWWLNERAEAENEQICRRRLRLLLCVAARRPGALPHQIPRYPTPLASRMGGRGRPQTLIYRTMTTTSFAHHVRGNLWRQRQWQALAVRQFVISSDLRLRRRLIIKVEAAPSRDGKKKRRATWRDTRCVWVR